MSAAGRPAARGGDRLGPGRGRPVVVDAGERRVDGHHGGDRLPRDADRRSPASRAPTAGPGRGSTRARARSTNDRAGKLRFRSTSWAEFLRPRATPSGLTAGSSQTGRRARDVAGGEARRQLDQRLDARRLVAVDAAEHQQRRPRAAETASRGSAVPRSICRAPRTPARPRRRASVCTGPHFTLRLTFAQWRSSCAT